MTLTTLFGAPLGYTPDTLTRWILTLTRTWIAFASREPGDLQDDLDALRPYFGTGANAKALRAALAAMPEVDDPDALLSDDLALHFGDRALITPEGRVLLDVLHAVSLQDDKVISETQIARAQHHALQARSGWSREWADKQLGGTMSASVLGAACFLLINGSVGPDQALRLPDDDTDDRALARIILPMIATFSERLGGKPLDLDSGLRSHWVFTQVSRLLPLDVGRDKGTGGTHLYVRADREQLLLDGLRTRLHRFDPLAVDAALQRLLADYRTARGALTALGQTHEEPRHTQSVTRALTSRP